MVSKKVTVVNERGIHMRFANMFVAEMGKFDCDVTLLVNRNEIDAKSIMNIISSCIRCGTEIEIQCDGADENEALEKALDIISAKFEE